MLRNTIRGIAILGLLGLIGSSIGMAKASEVKKERVAISSSKLEGLMFKLEKEKGRIVVENSYFHVILQEEGGKISSILIPGNKHNFIYSSKKGAYGIGKDMEAKNAFHRELFHIPWKYRVEEGEENLKVIFTISDYKGLSFTKTYLFCEDSPIIKARVEIENKDDLHWFNYRTHNGVKVGEKCDIDDVFFYEAEEGIKEIPYSLGSRFIKDFASGIVGVYDRKTKEALIFMFDQQSLEKILYWRGAGRYTIEPFYKKLVLEKGSIWQTEYLILPLQDFTFSKLNLLDKEKVISRWIKGEPKPAKPIKANLASASNGAYVITSSNKNFGSYYADNLIDRDEGTSWRSFDPPTKEFPQWIELYWDFYPIKVNKIAFKEIPPSYSTAYSLYRWDADKWKLISQSNKRLKEKNGYLTWEFNEVKTDRLKLVFEKAKGEYIKIAQLCAFGSDQELPFARDGKLYYDDTEPREEMVVEDITLNTDTVEPGHTLHVDVQVRLKRALQGNYVFVCSLREKELSWDSRTRPNYTLARVHCDIDTPTSQRNSNESYVIKADIKIPAFAPEGKMPIRLDGLGLSDGKQLRLVDSAGKAITDEEIAVVHIRRFSEEIQPDKQKHNFSIVKESGMVTFKIDGKKIPPMAFAIQAPSYEKLHRYTKETGVKVYQLQIYPYRIYGYDYQQRNFNIVDQHIRNLLRVDPEAYILVEFDLRTSDCWRQAHPEAYLTTHNGTKAHESFAAKEYKDEVLDYMKNLVHFIDSRPYAGHVMGYICEIGEPEGVLSGGPEIGDYNHQAIEAFRDFVREKYHNSVSELQNVYNNPEITFEAVYPTHSEIMADGQNGGIFLNPLKRKLTIDYHEFLASMIPEFFVENVARVLKEESNRKVIVGLWWGYLLEDLMHGQLNHQRSHSYLANIIDSPYVDFYLSPFNYDYPARHAGDPYLTFQPNDVMKLHGKLQIPDADNRTFRAGTVKYGRNYSQKETIAILKRDGATAIIQGTGNQLSDWTNYRGTPRMSAPFFLDDMILDTLNKLRKLYKHTLSLPREKTADIAVFVSGKSYYYHDNNAEPLYKNLIGKVVYKELMQLGAPYDIYLFEDIKNSFIQNKYKLYIFLNPFYITEEERKAVESIKKDGKSLLWFYGPGYINDNRGLSVSNIEDLTGIKVTAEFLEKHLQFNVINNTHPLTQGFSIGAKIDGPTVSPRFYVTDTDSNLTVLGRYPDSKPSFVVKDFGNWKSIYSCVPYLPTKILRNIAKHSGCHIYVDEDIYIDAERHFLMLTNGFEKERDLVVRLPQKNTVYNAFSGKMIAKKTNQFSIKLPRCETGFYFLDVKPPSGR